MAHVVNITIDNAKVAGDLTDFPVYVNLADLPAGFWNTVANGGGDIRVFKSDGTTELAREVVSCNTATNTGELHFKYSGTLSGSVDTVVQIHADGTSADYAVTDTYGRNAVWSDYRYVAHLTSSVEDSSGNITPSSAGTSFVTTSKIGPNAVQFAGNNTSQNIIANIVGRTITGWVRNTNSVGGNYFVDARGGLTNGYLYYDVSSDALVFGTGFTSVYLNASLASSTVTTLPTATWGHLTLKTSAQWTDSGTDFGIRYTTPVANDSWAGQFDEIRVTKTLDLSTDWITTEYNNQNSPATFYTATAVTSGPANLKSYNTNVKANIKSINTNLIANVKSLNTNI